MSRWRIAVVAVLISVPFTALALVGSYYLWMDGWGFVAWWPMAACMMLGYLLGWYWQRKQQLLRPVDFDPPTHWTERDEQAWQLVEARAKKVPAMPSAQLSDLNFYVTTGQEMALELAQFYHPKALDPLDRLTIPEILAVIELASHDMAEIVDKYLPGGHLLTVKDWKRARTAVEWAPAATNLYWVISALFSPVNTAIRFTASQVGLSGPFQMLQQNLLVWFYTAYLHRLGTYLIDLNSGRLRIGAGRYRELLQQRQAALAPQPQAPAANGPAGVAAPPPAADAVDQVQRVTLTLMGQVKAGKSSLINALLGEQRAVTDVLPATKEIARYELQPTGVPTRLVLLDTVGYAHTGPKADQVKATREAAQQSDLLLLVLQARNPARQADLDLLKQLKQWFADHPELKRPPILAVLTHIDLLSPALEWAPPYNWQQPTRLKEQQIQQALAAVRDQLGDYVTAVVPVCGQAGKVYGVEEGLLPAVAELLDEVHAVAMLRCLKAEVDKAKVRKVFHQLLASGKEAVKVLWERLPR